MRSVFKVFAQLATFISSPKWQHLLPLNSLQHQARFVFIFLFCSLSAATQIKRIERTKLSSRAVLRIAHTIHRNDRKRVITPAITVPRSTKSRSCRRARCLFNKPKDTTYTQGKALLAASPAYFHCVRAVAPPAAFIWLFKKSFGSPRHAPNVCVLVASRRLRLMVWSGRENWGFRLRIIKNNAFIGVSLSQWVNKISQVVIKLERIMNVISRRFQEGNWCIILVYTKKIRETIVCVYWLIYTRCFL